MKILILGGTVFVGRHLVEAAMARGHEVTLFNRGQHNPDLFAQVEKLRGDRDGQLDVLQGRQWDVAIDTCGYVPRVVRASSEFLADAVDRYIFISSVSVYSGAMTEPNVDEDGSLGALDDPSVEKITGETYGPLKALCEGAAEGAMPGRVLTIRPGLIVGPDDPTDRFTYWPVRVGYGGEVLVPLPPDRFLQFIDVRDLAEWTIRMAEIHSAGVYNATGPDYTLTMDHLLQESKRVSASDARFTWVDEAFLLDEGVKPWSELPLWIPDGPGFLRVNIDKAINAALSFRPLAQTIRDTLAWYATQPSEREPRAGITPERERELLQAWAE